MYKVNLHKILNSKSYILCISDYHKSYIIHLKHSKLSNIFSVNVFKCALKHMYIICIDKL